MSDEILNKVITLEEVSQTTTSTGKTRYKIKGGGLNFGLWKLKADGTETRAFQYLASLGLDSVGKTVKVAYKEDAGEYEGKAITYRTIIGMEQAVEMPTRQEQTYQPSSTSNQPVNYDTKNLEDKIKSLESRVSVLEGKSTQPAPENAPESTTEPSTGTPQAESGTGTDIIGDNGEKIHIPF